MKMLVALLVLLVLAVLIGLAFVLVRWLTRD